MKILVNGIELFYEISGQGRPLILVHGNGEDGVAGRHETARNHPIGEPRNGEVDENRDNRDAKGHGQRAHHAAHEGVEHLAVSNLACHRCDCLIHYVLDLVEYRHVSAPIFAVNSIDARVRHLPL